LRIASFAIVLAGLALSPALVHAQRLYWLDTFYGGPGIYKADDNGIVLANQPLTAGSLPEGLAVDAGGKLYWAEAAWANAMINRAAPTLASITPIVSGGSAYRGIAVDNVDQYVYWTSSNLVTGSRVHRASFNGSGATTLMALGAGANPRGIAVDRGAGKLYWADFDLNAIYSANLNGTGVAPLISLAAGSGPYGVAVDPVGQILYWTEYNSGLVRRATTAGAGVVTLVSGLANPTYLALDLPGGRMFWTEGGAGTQQIRRAFTNGSGTVTLSGMSSYGGIAYISDGNVATPGPELPAEFSLERVWPSPARGPVHVGFSLPRAAHTRVSVIDLQGRVVEVLADGVVEAGRHERTWNARSRVREAPAGIYFVRLSVDGRHWDRRLVLTR
jgi:DNA-binding beta-propeller fold protein YncE